MTDTNDSDRLDGMVGHHDSGRDELPEEAFQSSSDVIEPFSSIPLLARGRELGALADVYAAAIQGRGGVALITGEAGSGKTSTVRRFFRTVGESEVLVLMARSFEGDASLPFGPWLNVLASRAELAARLPQPLGTRQPPALRIGDLAQQVAASLVALSREHPVVLAFDDLHLTDESSLALVRSLAQRLDSASILLILTVRTPLEPGNPLESWMPLVMREAQVTLLELQPIPEAEIFEFVRQRFSDLSRDQSRHVSHQLASLSGGNGLFLSELVAIMSDSTSRSLTPLDRLRDLPASLQGAVDSRASRLSTRAVETLRLAAIVGDVIDLDLLAELRRLDPDAIIADLEEALSEGLLTEDRHETRFRHGIFREGLTERISGLRRRRQHAMILDVLRRRPQPRLIDIAFHAEQAGDLQTACAALEQAAQAAIESFALPEAARLLGRALAIAEAQLLDPAHQDNLRLALADSLMWNDLTAAQREVERVMARASARRDERALARARQRKAMLLYEEGWRSESIALLEQTIPELERLQDSAFLADALMYAGYCYASQDDFVTLERVASRLVGVADSLGSAQHRAVALMFIAVGRVAQGKPTGAAEIARESIETMVALNRIDTAAPSAAVTVMRIDVLANLHRPAMFDALVKRGEELEATYSSRLGLQDQLAPIEFAYGRFLRGDWGAARQVVAAWLNASDQPLPRVQWDVTFNVAAEIAEHEERLRDAEDLLHNIAPRPEIGIGDHSYQQWLFAVERLITLRLRAGDIGGAQSWIEALDRALAERPHVPGELLLLLSQARLAIATQDCQSALEILDEVRTRAEETTNMLVLIHALQLMAGSNRQAGNLDTALQTANEAVGQAERCKLPYEVAVSRLHRAEVRWMLPGAEAALRDDLEAVRATLEQLGARAALRRLEDLEREVGRRERMSRLSRPAGLTEREVDVLRLVARGLSDRRIAEQLYISPRTVTTHVGNLLGKTMTANRTELALWAVEHGFVEQE